MAMLGAVPLAPLLVALLASGAGSGEVATLGLGRVRGGDRRPAVLAFVPRGIGRERGNRLEQLPEARGVAGLDCGRDVVLHPGLERAARLTLLTTGGLGDRLG